MLGLTKKQLLLVLDLNNMDDGTLITAEFIQKLFVKYGDGYFRDHGYGASWTLTDENKVWENMRGKAGIPRKEDD